MALESHNVVGRFLITNRKALVPDACIGECPPEELEDYVVLRDWRAFSVDANKSIAEWKVLNRKKNSLGWPMLFLATICFLGSAFAYAYTTLAFALLVLFVAIVCFIAGSWFLFSGSKAERSARSDLKSVLDWHSEDREGVSFELEKKRVEGTWLPVYLYFIKVTAEIDPNHIESSPLHQAVDLDSSLSVEIDVESSMKDPLLRSCSEIKERD
uniref:Uncharacterized protein n=1 Tax=Odontella aurita TaxID=265563 RepID=A0A7S4N7R0_9STRA